MTIIDTFIGRKLAEFENACKKEGIPVTIQRRTILTALAGRKDHPTAEDIYLQIIDILPGISKTTVYRVLETMVGLGVVRRISNAESRSRFDADTSRHHHVQCTECGIVVDIHDRALNNMSLPPTIPSGFLVIDYSISFSGLCPSCRGSAPH
jgi:Fur family peroxide stress response transcriptional regulator